MKSVANELEKHWLFIVDNNIGIPIHQTMIGNEDEKAVYTNTKFLSDTFEIENSASLIIRLVLKTNYWKMM